MIELSYMPDWRWLVGTGAAVVLLLFASYYFAVGRPPWGLRISLLALRCGAIGAVVFCLLNPQRVEEIRHRQTAQMAVLLDTSRSMSLQDVPKSRLDAAKSWLREELEPAWSPSVARAGYEFHQQLQPLPDFDTASPTGGTTGIAEALEALLAVPREEPLTGVILCSDGVATSGRDPLPMAKIYRRKGIPIHTLTVGTTKEMQDIVLENVQVKRAVPNEAPTRIGIVLRAPGYAGRQVPVQIRRGSQVFAMQEVALTGSSQRVEMDFTPHEKGFQTYEVTISAQPGEWLAGNNRRFFGLEVIDPVMRVVYMEGTPQQSSADKPEWKYLKDALESDQRIKVKVLYQLSSGNGDYRNTVDADPDTGEKVYPVHHPTQGFPRTMADLLKYDVIVHSDIKVQFFSPEQMQNMARFVEQHGGGFVMIGGNSAFGRGGYQKTIIDRIIPVAMQQYSDTMRMPFQMQVPPGALDHPVMAIGSSRAETAKIWTEKLPRLHGFNRVDRSKPGAIVLGETPHNLGSSGYGQRVVLAVQEIGKGRTMAFTSDITRTWGQDYETLWGERINPSLPLRESNCDSRYYRAFWINAIRWLAAGKVGKTNNAVSLELAQSYSLPHQPVTASVKVRDPEGNDLSGADVALAVSIGSTNKLTLKPAFNPATRSYTCELRPNLAAQYVVTATAKQKDQPLGEDKQLLICENADQELLDVRANPDLMAKIAQVSGGKTFVPATQNAAALTSIFNSAPPVTVNYRRMPLWDNAWWFGGILGLLTLEWIIRRLRGLA